MSEEVTMFSRVVWAEDPERTSLVRHIINVISAKGYSQDELSKEVDITRFSAGQLMKGKASRFTDDHLKNILEKLNKDFTDYIDKLLEEDPEALEREGQRLLDGDDT